MNSNSLFTTYFEELLILSNCLQLMLTLYFKFQHFTLLPPLMVSMKCQQTVCSVSFLIPFLLSMNQILQSLDSSKSNLSWKWLGLIPLPVVHTSILSLLSLTDIWTKITLNFFSVILRMQIFSIYLVSNYW